MKIIGLCGQSGAGKTTALEAFLKKGFAVVDCDEVARLVTRPGTVCLEELREAFGDDIIFPDGSLDRKRLAAIAFSDKEKHRRLNKITHFHILKKLDDIIKEKEALGFSAVVVDAPLLFESGLNKRCDKTIALLADEKVRLERIMARDFLTEEEARARISNQLSEKELERLSDFTVYNNEKKEDFLKEINAVVQKIGEEIE